MYPTGTEVFYQEPDHTIYCGHALDILRQMPDESVDMAITSPPYWGLRTYKTEPIIWGDNHCEHEWGELMLNPMVKSGKHGPASVIGAKDAQYEVRKESNQGNFCLKCHAWKGELGLEPTIELYIEHLILIFNEVKRVLKKTGTCWVNLDDSYAANRSYQVPDSKWCDVGNNMAMSCPSGIPAKSLCLIPQRFAIAMVNAGWILRNDIVWNKPNPMPESVKDRFTGSWEHLFFFTKSRRYYFEQQFDPYTEPLNRWGGPTLKRETEKTAEYKDMLRLSPTSGLRAGNQIRPHEELGRNKRDLWEIPTEPYPEAHFATFPEKLCEIPILAGCPSMICRECGQAREKIYKSRLMAHDGNTKSSYEAGTTANRLALLRQAARERGEEYKNDMEFLGYTDCDCNAGFESGGVLDPFTGSGTTQAVAKRLGRKSIGIELNPDYCKLAARRLQEIPMAMPLLVA